MTLATRVVIVTGSRTWDDYATLRRALDAELSVALRNGQVLVLRHGKASSGADRMAAQWCSLNAKRFGDRVREDPRPADWAGSPGRSGGHRRNATMLSDGADKVTGFVMRCELPACLGKVPHGTHGTIGCLNTARKAGLAIDIYRERGLPQILPAYTPAALIGKEDK